MNNKHKQSVNGRKLSSFFLGCVLYIPFGLVYACSWNNDTGSPGQGGMQGSTRQMFAVVNMTQIAPGENTQSPSMTTSSSLRCPGRSQALMKSAFALPTWRSYYSTEELRRAVGVVRVAVSTGTSAMIETYDLVRGRGTTREQTLGVQNNAIYNIDIGVLAGQSQIVSETRLAAVPAADSNVIMRIVSLGGSSGSDLRISSGILPIINYCHPANTSHYTTGVPVEFGNFKAGGESGIYNRTKNFSINVRINARCDEPVTPTVSFSLLDVNSGGDLSDDQTTINFNNGLRLQFKQSSGATSGRVVRLEKGSKHEFETLRPGSLTSRSGSLSFDAMLSKQNGMTVTSGRFMATIRYHLEYR